MSELKRVIDGSARGPQRNYAHRSPVNDVVIHPNQGELISCDQNGSIKIWDLGGNACTHELVPEEDVPMRSLSIASDGSLLVAGNNKGSVYVWKMLSTRASQLAATSLPVAKASPTGDDVTWDLQPVTKIQAHSKYLLRTVLSPDVKFVVIISNVV
jgi:G protein beta subunit-like protein